MNKEYRVRFRWIKELVGGNIGLIEIPGGNIPLPVTHVNVGRIMDTIVDIPEDAGIGFHIIKERVVADLVAKINSSPEVETWWEEEVEGFAVRGKPLTFNFKFYREKDCH